MCFTRNCKICAAIRKNRRLYEKIKDMEDNEKQVRSGEEREREVNKSWTDRWRSAKLSPSAWHDPFQRHVGSNQRAKKSRAMEEGGREEEGFTLKYVDPRAILGLFSLHPAGCSGRIPVRHAGRESVYRMIQKHRIIFLSLWTGARSLSRLLLTLLLRETPAGM